jgi:multidrug efflux pump subunit AcrB
VPRKAAKWVVLEGLKAGEQVMVDGFQKMRPNVPVKPVPWSPAAAPAAAAPARRRRPPPPRRRRRAEGPGMAQFFINRPIFAWVIALFIMVAGGVAITQLPVAQYPPVAPPSIVVNAVYPGASAQTLEDSVLSVIEREMNGSPGLIYIESVAQADGSGSITLSFEPGTNADLAQVDVQNRLSRATPRLPQAVVQQGVRVDKARSNFLLFTILSSEDPAMDPVALGDYASRNVLPELQRVPGVGQAQLFGTERAMRIWIDPAKLVGYRLSAAEVNAAIAAQNAQVASGTIGDLPNVPGQGMSATVVVRGQLHGGAVRRHRAACQRRRLHGAPEGRGAHRAGRAELRHARAAQRPAVHRHRRAAVAHRQRLATAKAIRSGWTSWAATSRRA